MRTSARGNGRYHSAFGVLKYSHPKEIFIGNFFLCETDFWVPPMFALVLHLRMCLPLWIFHLVSG